MAKPHSGRPLPSADPLPEIVPGPILSQVSGPESLKKLTVSELEALSNEVREYLVDVVTRVGGHLAPSLGVVELSIALHSVLNTPEDKIIWDVGHQSYVHKILTGRRDALKTIRQEGGLSGFCKRDESPHDVFGAGHASTAISSALGIATARDLAGKNFKVVAVVGDGGMTGGLAYEGMNNAGISERDFIVILNDNAMSISPNVGAISRYLANVISSPIFNKVKGDVWKLTEILPATKAVRQTVRKVEESLKTLLVPGMLFEDFGFRYLGPFDGHNLKTMLTVLQRVKGMKGPILLHVLTTKGKGLPQAEGDPVKYHGVKPIAPAVTTESGKVKAAPKRPAYTHAFSEIMLRLADRFPEMVAVTAAMSEGTGLTAFAGKHPGRFFDVGIAEAHAVCFCAGLATQGLRPVAAIYSTFLQRAYDQIIHDVAVQRLPVVFALDRAGVVGEDGPTHHGTFDLSYLGCVPGMIVAAPRDGKELGDLLYTALLQKDHPFAVRYPRDTIPPDRPPTEDFAEIPIGSWEILKEGRDVCILAIGTMVRSAQQACDLLAGSDVHPTLVNARFLNPVDEELLQSLLAKHTLIVTAEENVADGGFGARVSQWAHDELGRATHRWLHLAIPPRFVEHAPRERLFQQMGLDPQGVASRVLAAIHTSKPLVGG